MLMIKSEVCYTDTAQDAQALWWLDQAVSHDPADHSALRCINVRPNLLETANGYCIHQIQAEHTCEFGTYLLDGGKKLNKSKGVHRSEVWDETQFPDTDRVTSPLIGAATWTVRVRKDELLWALAMPDKLALILTINAEGDFSAQEARAAYNRVEDMPDPLSAYLWHEVLVQPDNAIELQVGVDPKLLTAAAQMPAPTPFLILSFTDATHAMLVRSEDFQYQAIIMPMHLGR